MYKHITKEGKEFDELALLLADGNVKEVFCDLETTGLNHRTDKILMFQIMAKEEIFIYDFLNLNNEHLKYLVNLLEATKVLCVFHNTKFDMKFLYQQSGKWLSNVFDTMNCEVLINAGLGKSLYSLDSLVLKYCGVELDKSVRESFHTEVITAFSNQQLIYSAKDILYLEEIYRKQIQQIIDAKEEKVLEIEMNLLPVVAKMEYDGVILDVDRWSVLADEAIAKRAPLEEAIKHAIVTGIKQDTANAFEFAELLKIPVKTKKARVALESILDKDAILDWAKENFNIQSYVQLPTGLNLIGINVESANKKEFEKHKNKKVIQYLLERSEYQKNASTYGYNVIEQIDPVTGRLHTNFLNMGAATGRFSSSGPNLQNIPTANGYRESFIATLGWDWISMDYSQQEYRLAGGVSREQKIIDAYLEGADMHTATASIMFGKKLEDVTRDERAKGKTINFAILYGSTKYGLKHTLGVTLERAEEVLETFYAGYPRLSAFKRAVEDMILEVGYSCTPLGRRRYNIERPLYVNNFELEKYRERVKKEGFNHIIQGGGADIVKIAMINIYNKNPFGDKFRMLIQVHDEINAEAHKSISADAVEFMKEEMLSAEAPFIKPIPAKVDYKLNDCWVH